MLGTIEMLALQTVTVTENAGIEEDCPEYTDLGIYV